MLVSIALTTHCQHWRLDYPFELPSTEANSRSMMWPVEGRRGEGRGGEERRGEERRGEERRGEERRGEERRGEERRGEGRGGEERRGEGRGGEERRGEERGRVITLASPMSCERREEWSWYKAKSRQVRKGTVNLASYYAATIN